MYPKQTSNRRLSTVFQTYARDGDLARTQKSVGDLKPKRSVSKDPEDNLPTSGSRTDLPEAKRGLPEVVIPLNRKDVSGHIEVQDVDSIRSDIEAINDQVEDADEEKKSS